MSYGCTREVTKDASESPRATLASKVSSTFWDDLQNRRGPPVSTVVLLPCKLAWVRHGLASDVQFNVVESNSCSKTKHLYYNWSNEYLNPTQNVFKYNYLSFMYWVRHGSTTTFEIKSAELAVLHGSNTTWFQTFAKVEFNLINLRPIYTVQLCRMR